jgi:4-amino-4-deoxy-L-arabinose transferase-like glycosyltransferase
MRAKGWDRKGRTFSQTGSEKRQLVGIVSLGILLRVSMVLLDHPHYPGGDEPLFIEIAKSIVSGDGISYFDPRFPSSWVPGTPTASRAPGASFWLAGWFWLIGENYLVPRLVTAFLSGLSAYLYFRLGQAMHSNLTTGQKFDNLPPENKIEALEVGY